MSERPYGKRKVGDLDSLAICNCDEDLPVISDLGLTPCQHLILVLTRGICKALLRKQVGTWEEIISMAEDHAGVLEGQRIAGACIRLMLSVRMERRGTYHFRPICCRHVTHDECVLLNMVKAYQARPNQVHHKELEALVNGGMHVRTAVCASELGMIGRTRAVPASPEPFVHPAPRYLH